MHVRFRPTTVALSALVVVSLGINAVQGTRILKLESALDGKGSGARLEEGSVLPPLEVSDTTGAHEVIRYDATAQPTLLYVFSPSCIWCRRNAANLRFLAEQTKNGLRQIGLSLSGEGLGDFKLESGMNLPVYIPSPEMVKLYHLGETPTTIVVSPSGTILRVWSGAYSGLTKASIERHFKIAIPES